MKRFLIILLVLVGGFFIYKNYYKKKDTPREKPVPLTVSKHSEGFNQSVNEILTNYYSMVDGFVNWDSAEVNKNALSLQQALLHFKADDLGKDTAIYQTVIFPWDNSKNSVSEIISSGDWHQKRKALQDLSENLRMILITVKYDRAISYWQECPMAFGEGQSGNWLSDKETIVNPYLGKKDHQHGDNMLNCGETKSVIDFTKEDSTEVKKP